MKVEVKRFSPFAAGFLAGDACLPAKRWLHRGSAGSKGKRGDQRKSCPQWLNKLEREIMWTRASLAPSAGERSQSRFTQGNMRLLVGD